METNKKKPARKKLSPHQKKVTEVMHEFAASDLHSGKWLPRN